MLQKRDDLKEKAEYSGNINGTNETKHMNRNSDIVESIVAIGTSTGGPRALQEVIPMLPANILAAVLIVQHMPSGFTKSLAERLDGMSKIKVKEAEDGDILRKGCAYIAPGGRQMTVVKQDDQRLRIKITDDEPVGGHKPSVNVLFDSVSHLEVKKVVAVIMTGMGKDGSEGIININKLKKGYIIAQDEKTCTVYGMPKAAVQTGVVDEVVPLDEIAKKIMMFLGVYDK